MKEIIAVYQDCVLCGIKGRKKIAEYADKGVLIRKVGFTTEEGRDLCAKAIASGIGVMPFYVYDDKFATTIEELLEKTRKTTKKTTKKQKKVKGTDHGTITEA